MIKLVSHTARHSSTSCPMTLPLKVFVHLVPFSIRETYTLPELLSKGVSYISFTGFLFLSRLSRWKINYSSQRLFRSSRLNSTRCYWFVLRQNWLGHCTPGLSLAVSRGSLWGRSGMSGRQNTCWNKLKTRTVRSLF